MASGDDVFRSDLVWSRVHALTAVARCGSFTTAARQLGVSKAAVSQRVNELERTVGAALLQRTTRSVRLTHVGQQLVDDTSECFSRIESSVAAARDLAAQPRGVLRVSAPVALGRQYVAPSLEPFLRAAARQGLRFQAISDFCQRKDLPPGLVIGYTAMDDAALRRHVDELRRLIQSA